MNIPALWRLAIDQTARPSSVIRIVLHNLPRQQRFLDLGYRYALCICLFVGMAREAVLAVLNRELDVAKGTFLQKSRPYSSDRLGLIARGLEVRDKVEVRHGR